MELTPGALFGKYRLEARLGGGSFGAVWRATDTKARAKAPKTVALKILSGTFSESEGSQLRTDVELLAAAAAAGSEHVVKVLGGGLEPGPHVVMEFLEGTDLAASLNVRGKLPQAEVIGIGEAVADALVALGHVGIIHRDVKPANIMLLADGGVKLTDFGIAKIVGFDTVTSTGQLPLTMAYAAPEVWDGKASGASDLYALGVVLYQCLAGKLPFAGSYSEVYRGHLTGTPDYDLLPPDTTPALRSLIESCLGKEVASRPADPEAALTQLRRARGELDSRQGAVGGHPPVAFGPWQIVAPHPTRTWAWGAKNEKTGERAIVEVCFGPTAALGETLHRAVDANPALVPLGAERLLGTNRLILRPDEAWPVPPPSGPFAFWVAREELPVPPPTTLGEPELRRVVESVIVLRNTANAAGVRLDLGPTALVTLPDGSVHVRRPGLPADSTLDPDAAALDSIRRLPLELALTATVARAPNLADLGRELGVRPASDGGTMLGVAVTDTGMPSRPAPEAEQTIIRATSVFDPISDSKILSKHQDVKTPIAREPLTAPVVTPVPDRQHRRRRVLVPLLLGILLVAIAGLAAFGAYWGPGKSPSSASGSPGQIAAMDMPLSSSSVDIQSDASISTPGTISAAQTGTTDRTETQKPGPTVGPTAPPANPPSPGVTHGSTPTVPPTAPPTPTPTLLPVPNPPSNLQAHAQGKTGVWVGWTDNATNETSYEISDGSSTITLPADTNTYTWSVSANTQKCSEVRAVNSAGASPWVAWACATSDPNVYCNGGGGVTFWSGTGGNTGTPYGPFSPTAGSEIAINSFPFGQANSFTDPNGAWHVVVYENTNRQGNMTHYDSAQSDISSRHAYSATVYLKTC